MPCPACEAPTLDLQRYCTACGLELSTSTAFPALPSSSPCPVCSRQNPPVADFCLTCGSKLRTGSRSGRAITTSTTEERRTVTLLHADLCGFTRMTENLDPEHTRNLLQALFRALSHEILERGGKVIAFIGDALLAAFGAPVAYGDDPRRAADAALAIHQALRRFSHPVLERTGSTLKMRIGLETGPVVVGRFGARGQLTVTGPTLAAAMELERSATPGLTLVGETTQRFLADDYVLSKRSVSRGDAFELSARKGVSAADDLGTVRASASSSRAEREPMRRPAGMSETTSATASTLGGGHGDEVQQARLDALPMAERRLLRLASICGPRFWLELLERLGVVAPLPLLERLVEASELTANPHSSIHGTSEYAFVSAHLCHVAYQTNLLKVRQFNHLVVAAWLEEHIEEHLELLPLLVWHYQQGHDVGGMARALVLGGQRLASRRAIREAQERLEEAVRLLEALPARSPELQTWLDRAQEVLLEVQALREGRREVQA